MNSDFEGVAQIKQPTSKHRVDLQPKKLPGLEQYDDGSGGRKENDGTIHSGKYFKTPDVDTSKYDYDIDSSPFV